MKEMALTPEQEASLKASMSKGDDAVLVEITKIQAEQRSQLKDVGIDVTAMTPEVGKEIQWQAVVQMVFRVVEFDPSDTLITDDAQVKASSMSKPYGYLIVEAPTLNQAIRLPIVHRDDFMLATRAANYLSVGQIDPNLERQIESSSTDELLVIYAPKHEKNGYSASPHHVLHYAITPSGTLDKYYSDTPAGNRRMSVPEPQLIFNPFTYEGEIRVQMNPEPKV